MMEYIVNANTTTTTSEEVNNYLKGFSIENETEYPVEISFDILLQKTAIKLFRIFSKMYYEILKDVERLEILEYCLTLYSGVKRDIFTNFSALGLKLSNKQESLQFFLLHLIIFIAEKQEIPPLKVVETVCNGILSYKDKNQHILKPLNLMAKSSNVEQIHVRIDDHLLNLKNNLDKQLLTGLLVQLILLDMCDEYIK